MWFTFQSKQHFLHNFSICYQISCHRMRYASQPTSIFWNVIFHLGSKSFTWDSPNINNVTLIHLNIFVQTTRCSMHANEAVNCKLNLYFDSWRLRVQRKNSETKVWNLCFMHKFWVKSCELWKYANVIKHAYHYQHHHDELSTGQDTPKVIYISTISLTNLSSRCVVSISNLMQRKCTRSKCHRLLRSSRHRILTEKKKKKRNLFIDSLMASIHEKFKTKSSSTRYARKWCVRDLTWIVWVITNATILNEIIGKSGLEQLIQFTRHVLDVIKSI